MAGGRKILDRGNQIFAGIFAGSEDIVSIG